MYSSSSVDQSPGAWSARGPSRDLPSASRVMFPGCMFPWKAAPQSAAPSQTSSASAMSSSRPSLHILTERLSRPFQTLSIASPHFSGIMSTGYHSQKPKSTTRTPPGMCRAADVRNMVGEELSLMMPKVCSWPKSTRNIARGTTILQQTA